MMHEAEGSSCGLENCATNGCRSAWVAVMRFAGLKCSNFESRSAASGDAAGNKRCISRGSPHGRLSSMVAAKGDWMASMSSCFGRPGIVVS